MNQGERRLQHQARLEQINRMQRVTGTGDFARVDHAGITIERARMLDEEMCAHEATERGLAAFEPKSASSSARKRFRHRLYCWGSRPKIGPAALW